MLCIVHPSLHASVRMNFDASVSIGNVRLLATGRVSQPAPAVPHPAQTGTFSPKVPAILEIYVEQHPSMLTTSVRPSVPAKPSSNGGDKLPLRTGRMRCTPYDHDLQSPPLIGLRVRLPQASPAPSYVLGNRAIQWSRKVGFTDRYVPHPDIIFWSDTQRWPVEQFALVLW